MSDRQLELFDAPGTEIAGESRENGAESAPQGQSGPNPTAGGCRTR